MSKKSKHINHDRLNILSKDILNLANRGYSQYDFLEEVTTILRNFSGCDSAELWFKDSNNNYKQFKFSSSTTQNITLYTAKFIHGTLIPILPPTPLNKIIKKVIQKSMPKNFKTITSQGSIWYNSSPFDINKEKKTKTDNKYKKYKSISLIPLLFGDERVGLLQMMSRYPAFFAKADIEQYEILSQILGIAIINQSVQSALRERVKELSCLYNIAQLSHQHNNSISDTLQKIVELIPAAWQYPEITRGRISLENKIYATPGFSENNPKQTAKIIINNQTRGMVEVAYDETKPEMSEGPFLKEERNLIDMIAKQIALIIERIEAEKNHLELQEQLRHADRLATIGQLAAGVAHELNEPLGNILGFAQLMKKTDGIPHPAIKDIEKIVHASLNAREIIKKLMLFARQIPPNKTSVNLNQIVEEGLYFFEARFAKNGIKLLRKIEANLPLVMGDAAQLNQVLVNLVVNSIQAMPNGGELTISTISESNSVFLIVEDTGFGMSDEVLNKIFIPFFTTKEINEGTGLGLAVVHGIITTHKGKIQVQSVVDKGTRFEIQFPTLSKK
jgi:signal transduction histidine kinase